jgi:parvulin-like peptidyl-prolyl isomerase
MPLRAIPTILLVCVLALAAGACGGSDEKTSEDVPDDAIALVASTAIKKAEFDALLERAQKSFEARDQEFPKTGTAEYDDLKKRAVEFLVQQKQFAMAAAAADIEVTDEDVDARLEQIKKDNFGGDDAKFEKALSDEGLTLESARTAFHDQILQEKLYEKVTADVKPTDEEIEKYYEENKDRFSQPESRNVRHILVKSEAKADEIYQMLEDGGDFAKLAKKYSTDPGTKKDGGKLPITKGSTVAEFDKAAFALETGEYSKPVKTEFGWHLIYAIDDVTPATTTPLADIKESIEQQLTQEQQQKVINDWLEELKVKYPVVYAAGFEPPVATTTGESTTTTG